MNPILPSKSKPTMIIVTQDYSGLGFAKMSLDADFKAILAVKMKDKEEKKKEFEQIGEGIVPKIELGQILKAKSKYKNAYWVFDQNHNYEVADALRKEGFKVFGGHELTDKMEHDRKFGTDLVHKAGLNTPDTHEFSSISEGLTFLEQNEDKAYVFKPDEPDNCAWVTTVPDNDRDDKANEEIRQFLSAMSEGKGDFILQERKKGVEINVEVWLHKGQVFFAHANFECKRKYNKDLGKLIGCAQDIEFTIPIDCKLVKETLAKLIKLPEFKSFTGMVDMNLIVADRDYYFLEFCGRFGYNSHPNLFINLALDPFPEIIADFVDGRVQDFSKHFRPGFGASVAMTIDDPVTGLPLIIPEDVEKYFFHFDTYSENEQYFLGGYGNEVGIICSHDYDLKSAADDVLLTFEKIHYPSRAGRTDINQTDYLTNPYERWVAANAMKLFDV